MIISVYGSDRQLIGLLETFISFIWTEHYREPGDFELSLKPSSDALTLLAKDNFLAIERSDKWMIIETRQVVYDPEEQYTLFVRGRSLESILDRRIVLAELNYQNTSMELGVHDCLYKNAVNCGGQPARNFVDFRLVLSGDSYIEAQNMTAKYIHKELLYEIVMHWTSVGNIGWQIHHNPTDGYFEFKLYRGDDRSPDQSTFPPVMFSPTMQNLLSGEWVDSYRNFKTYALVIGDDTAGPYHTREVGLADRGESLRRREGFIDATHISKFYIGSSTELPVAQYVAILDSFGYQYLYNTYKHLDNFMGEIQPDVLFRYNEHFFLGDVVYFEDEYGHSGKARVSSYSFGEDASGVYSYPTFEPV